jgi:hypothetical protein
VVVEPLLLGMPEVLTSLDVPGVVVLAPREPVDPVADPVALGSVVVEPEAPMEVPLPVVEPVVLAVESVELVPGVVVAVLGEVVLGAGVVVVVDDEVEVSVVARSPQAASDRAAIRARAAQRAIGMVFMRFTPLGVAWVFGQRCVPSGTKL